MAITLTPTPVEVFDAVQAAKDHIHEMWLPCGSMSVTEVLGESLLYLADEDWEPGTDAGRALTTFRDRFGEAAMLRAIGVALSTWESE